MFWWDLNDSDEECCEREIDWFNSESLRYNYIKAIQEGDDWLKNEIREHVIDNDLCGKCFRPLHIEQVWTKEEYEHWGRVSNVKQYIKYCEYCD